MNNDAMTVLETIESKSPNSKPAIPSKINNNNSNIVAFQLKLGAKKKAVYAAYSRN
jgi:hypothetical protein